MDLQANRVTVLAEGVDLKAIPQAIFEAGYQPGEMQLRARGTVSGGVLRIPGWEPLRVKGAPDGELELRARVDTQTDPASLISEP